jgi:large subunit ribosomal protein L9
MQVILLERIGRIGGIGDVVKVRNGFARNFLLPQGKALRATEENKARFEREREALEQLNADRREAASGKAGNLEGARFVLLRQAGESGQLYGSVTARDIAEAAAKDGHEVTRGQVSLDLGIKSVGLYQVKIQLHAEVAATVTINVARTAEEAERQARGENVILAQAEEDRAVADARAVELFEAGAEPELESETVPNSESSSDAGERT